jgi:hypothetical protein
MMVGRKGGREGRRVGGGQEEEKRKGGREGGGREGGQDLPEMTSMSRDSCEVLLLLVMSTQARESINNVVGTFFLSESSNHS